MRLNIKFPVAQPFHHFKVTVVKEAAGLCVQSCNRRHIFRNQFNIRDADILYHPLFANWFSKNKDSLCKSQRRIIWATLFVCFAAIESNNSFYKILFLPSANEAHASTWTLLSCYELSSPLFSQEESLKLRRLWLCLVDTVLPCTPFSIHKPKTGISNPLFSFTFCIILSSSWCCAAMIFACHQHLLFKDRTRDELYEIMIRLTEAIRPKSAPLTSGRFCFNIHILSYLIGVYYKWLIKYILRSK